MQILAAILAVAASTQLLIASPVYGLSAVDRLADKFVFTFEPKLSAGIDGTITAQYITSGDVTKSTRAKITVALDFSGVDRHAVQAFNDHCSGDATHYQFHLHTKWNLTEHSASLSKCGVDFTGRHYDPRFSCGPGSEYVNTDHCPASKVDKYNCTPSQSSIKFSNCELGDLSGRLGRIRVSDYPGKKVKWTVEDVNFPGINEFKASWNIVLHAVCGSATPRIACAVGVKAK